MCLRLSSSKPLRLCQDQDDSTSVGSNDGWVDVWMHSSIHNLSLLSLTSCSHFSCSCYSNTSLLSFLWASLESMHDSITTLSTPWLEKEECIGPQSSGLALALGGSTGTAAAAAAVIYFQGTNGLCCLEKQKNKGRHHHHHHLCFL